MTVSFTNVAPIADAGVNLCVPIGSAVTLDGSGSHDVNLDPLTYRWSIVTKPEGSSAALVDPEASSTTFVADKLGIYVVSLVVNDGFVDSAPANVTVQSVSCPGAAVLKLREAIDAINAPPPESFKNPNMRNTLTNKINVVLSMIEEGNYAEALDKLSNDVIRRPTAAPSRAGSTRTTGS